MTWQRSRGGLLGGKAPGGARIPKHVTLIKPEQAPHSCLAGTDCHKTPRITVLAIQSMHPDLRGPGTQPQAHSSTHIQEEQGALSFRQLVRHRHGPGMEQPPAAQPAASAKKKTLIWQHCPQ